MEFKWILSGGVDPHEGKLNISEDGSTVSVDSNYRTEWSWAIGSPMLPRTSMRLKFSVDHHDGGILFLGVADATETDRPRAYLMDFGCFSKQGGEFHPGGHGYRIYGCSAGLVISNFEDRERFFQKDTVSFECVMDIDLEGKTLRYTLDNGASFAYGFEHNEACANAMPADVQPCVFLRDTTTQVTMQVPPMHVAVVTFADSEEAGTVVAHFTNSGGDEVASFPAKREASLESLLGPLQERLALPFGEMVSIVDVDGHSVGTSDKGGSFGVHGGSERKAGPKVVPAPLERPEEQYGALCNGLFESLMDLNIPLATCEQEYRSIVEMRQRLTCGLSGNPTAEPRTRT